MPKPLPLNRLFAGAVSLERGDAWIKPWRLPFSKLALYPPEDGIIVRAEDAAGVRLRFRTDSPRLELAVLPADEARLFDLVSDGEILQTATLEAGEVTLALEDVPTDREALEIWLPQTHPVAVRELRVLSGRALEGVPDPRPRWVTYGSSITHCRTAHSPARTWPAVVARERGLHLTCLGYGGNCHLEPMIGRLIRDLPADVVTLKLGINVQGSASLSARTFRPAVIGLVRLIRESHPDVPIGVMSPIISPPREETPNVAGMSLRTVRTHIQDAVRRLVDCGDPNLHYYDGSELFGDELVEYLPDLLHPNGDGYLILGRRISERVFGSAPFARVVVDA